MQKILVRLIGLSLCFSTGSLQLTMPSAASDYASDEVKAAPNTGSTSPANSSFPAALQSTQNQNEPSQAVPADELNPLPNSLQRVIGVVVEQNGEQQKIVRVGVNSSAAQAGLQEGDEIIHASLSSDNLFLLINNSGRQHTANIKLASQSQSAGNARSAKQPQSGAATKNEIKPFELKAEQIASAASANNRIPRPASVMQESTQPFSASAANNQFNGAATSRLINPADFKAGRGQLDQGSPYNLNANRLAMQTENHGFPIIDINNHGMPIVDINSPIRLLANYQLELIVDQSLSMRRKDCPGGLSRWDWCGMQAEGLSRSISAFVPEGLTITPFSTNYRVYRQSSAQNVVELFQRGGLSFGTRLAEPLSDRLNSFFKNRQRNSKPLLIAVITDGIPFPPPEPQMVIDELVKATRRMNNPSEVTVVFFQIGGKDRFGHNYLQYLDTSLFKDGARFHLVHTVPFEQLQQSGLANALVQTLQTYGQSR